MRSPLSLVTAIGLLVGGGWEVRTQDDQFAAMLIGSGFIVLGVWLTLEIRDVLRGKREADSASTERD